MRGLSFAIFALAVVSCGVGGGATPSASAGSDAFSQGLALQKANKPDEAVPLYYQALSKDPKNKFALFNLGQIEDTKGHAVAAEAWYRLALEADRQMPEALYNLGLIRQKVGDSVESASLLRAVIAINPNNAAAHYNLGLALRSLGQNTAAVTEFATAQRLDPNIVPPPSPSPTR